jgi:PEP-CTERM motif
MTVETSSNSSSTARQGSLKRRAAYSVAAGAAACVAANQANAAIIYSGVQDIAIGSGLSQNLDINADSQGDVKLKNYVFGGGPYQGATVNFAPGKIVGFTGANTYVSALAAGSPINSTTANPTFFGSMAFGANNPSAQFNNANHAFMGLSFPAGANLFYGWVRVTINNSAGTFVVNDWAYNNVSGSPINAGDIPEPTTLGLLAAGAFGVAALRRKRKK